MLGLMLFIGTATSCASEPGVVMDRVVSPDGSIVALEVLHDSGGALARPSTSLCLVPKGGAEVCDRSNTTLYLARPFHGLSFSWVSPSVLQVEVKEDAMVTSFVPELNGVHVLLRTKK
jgi:hypothetical protein